MSGYISKVLTKYQHAIPPLPQHQPYKSIPAQYCAKVQHFLEQDTSALPIKDQIKHVQNIIGTLIQYVQAANTNVVATLSSISPHQAKNTEAALRENHQLLDYVETHSNAAI